MKTTKLYSILASLEGKEWRAIKKAALSPLMGGNPELAQLLDLLQLAHPKYPETLDYKQSIFTQLHPDKSYDDLSMRQYYTKLRAMIEQTLIFIRSRDDKRKRIRALALLYKEKGLLELYESKMQTLFNEYKSQALIDLDTLKEKAELVKEWAYYHQSDRHTSFELMNECVSILRQCYWAERNLMESDFITVEKSLGEQIERYTIDEISVLDNELFKNAPANFKIYCWLPKLLNGNNKEVYTLIETMFFEQIDDFSKKDRLIIFGNMTNWCSKQLNMGDSSIEQPYFNLLKLGLSYGLQLNKKGKMTSASYWNIGTVAIKVGELEWVEKFHAEYKNLIHSPNKKEYVVLLDGAIAFYKGDFQRAIDTLKNKRITMINLFINRDSLVTRSYFELFLQDRSYFQLLDSDIKAFYVKMKRKGHDKNRGARFIKLNQFLKEYATTSYSGNDVLPVLNKWQKKVDDGVVIGAADWLAQKIKSLKG